MEDIVVSYFSSVLYEEDMLLLSPRQWLNDHCITFWYEFLAHRIFDCEERLLFLHPSAAFMARFEDDLSTFHPLGLDRKEAVFIPINDNPFAEAAGGNHWSLLVWHAPENRSTDSTELPLPRGFSHWDSCMAGSGNFSVAEETARSLLALLGPDKSGAVHPVCCGQQTNGYDCGVFALYFSHHIAKAVVEGDASTLEAATTVNGEAIQKYRLHIRSVVEDFIVETSSADAASNPHYEGTG